MHAGMLRLSWRQMRTLSRMETGYWVSGIAFWRGGEGNLLVGPIFHSLFGAPKLCVVSFAALAYLRLAAIRLESTPHHTLVTCRA